MVGKVKQLNMFTVQSLEDDETYIQKVWSLDLPLTEGQVRNYLAICRYIHYKDNKKLPLQDALGSG